MKEVENDEESVKSSRSSKKLSGRNSKRSCHSFRSDSSENSCGRTSIDAIALEEKLRMTESLVKFSFTDKKHTAIVIREKMQQKEELGQTEGKNTNLG